MQKDENRLRGTPLPRVRQSRLIKVNQGSQFNAECGTRNAEQGKGVRVPWVVVRGAALNPSKSDQIQVNRTKSKLKNEVAGFLAQELAGSGGGSATGTWRSGPTGAAEAVVAAPLAMSAPGAGGVVANRA